MHTKFNQIPLIRSEDIEWKEVLTLAKDNNHVVSLQKLRSISPKEDLININAYTIFGLIPIFAPKILSRNEILTIFKGHNSTYM